MFRNRLAKTLRLLAMRPVWPFILQLLAWSPLVLLADRPEVTSFYLLALPGLAIATLASNLSLIRGLFGAFRMDEATRCNHALEHATISVLRQRGYERGVSGRAQRNGFRIAGIKDRAAIWSAFEEVRRLLAKDALPYVSVHCGSNLFTAQALGITLVAVGVLSAVTLQPPFWARMGLLASALLVFLLRQDQIGSWAQRRYFMSTSFSDASVRSVEKVKRRSFENGPVHFVQTVVWG